MTVLESGTARESGSMRAIFRMLELIERGGNRLPHPFWLFWILAGVLALASLVLSSTGVSVTLPDSGEVVTVRNLLSLEGVAFAVGSALDNFAAFPPLAVIVVVLLGVALAEKSGLITALLRVTVFRVRGRWVTFAVAYSGMLAHVMSDSAYLVMMPLGALAFRAAGRSAVLGVLVAYVSVGAGGTASLFVTPSDAVRSGIATAAAQLVDPGYVITPVAGYYFSIVSSFLLAGLITLVVELVLARRPEYASTHGDGEQDDHERDGGPLTAEERRGLRRSGMAFACFVLVVVGLLLLPGSPLMGEEGSIVDSVVVLEIGAFIALLFTLVGCVYGRTVGTIPGLSSVPTIMADGIARVAPVIVLFFAVSQVLAYFRWTGVGSVLTVRLADLLRSLQTPDLVVLLVVIVAVSILNLMVTSGIAMFSIIAPVLIPMAMYINLSPEATMVAFMIGDAVTNCVTPLSPYLILALGIVQRYRKDAGLGTVLSFTIPIAVVFLIGWSLLFVIWFSLGIPLGPGVHL